MSTFLIILLIIVGVGIFFLLREVFCWYYKINKTIATLEKQILLLEDIRNLLKNR